MKTMAVRLMIAMGLLVLPLLATGCDSEPEGSCITMSPFSTDFDTYGSHEVCEPHSTASACAEAHGRFQEGDDCAAFDLIHVLTAN